MAGQEQAGPGWAWPEKINRIWWEDQPEVE
jgi:hypothetical protein